MKSIIVTGANKGIGLAIVEAILENQAEAFVFLGSRDAERGELAVLKLIEKHQNWLTRLKLLKIDVTSDESVSRAVEEVRERLNGQPTPLYGLVNNAGVGKSAGFRGVLEVNTFGVQRVSEAFLPLIDPKQGRIVNVTSASGPMFVAKCTPERQAFFCDSQIERQALERLFQDCINMEGHPAAFTDKGLYYSEDAYGLSKALTNSYTMILARENPHLKINACTPGYIATDLTLDYAEGKSHAELGMKEPKDGARIPLHLLFQVKESGCFYGSDTRRSPLDRYRAPGTPPYSGC